MFQHTAARRRLALLYFMIQAAFTVSTHSRPKAADVYPWRRLIVHLFQHTAARRRLAYRNENRNFQDWFQHTAARRRLLAEVAKVGRQAVSTHSRPKAAAMLYQGLFLRYKFQHTAARRRLFSTRWLADGLGEFQHTAARRRLPIGWLIALLANWFQHTAARRRLKAPDCMAER